MRVALDGIQRAYRVIVAGETYYIHSPAFARAVRRPPRHPERRAVTEQQSASAPMPGRVLKLMVSEGRQVAAGDALLIA